MTQADFPIARETLARFQNAKKALLLTHYGPDGDALGSSAALAMALEAKGKTAHLYCAGSRQENLNFVIEKVKLLDEVRDADQYDLAVLLDCHDLKRTGPEDGPRLAALFAALSKPLPIVVIDHHLASETEEASGWVWDPAASSTGEMVLRLLNALGWEYSTEAAEAMLLAIASDTGFFSQANTTPGALRAAADLVAAGGSLEQVDRRVRKDWHVRRLRLMGLALNSLELHYGGRVAVMTVTPEMLKLAQAEMSDTEDLVDMARALSGVKLAALIKDAGKGRGTVRVSLRSRDQVSARDLAKSFGGGGHREASAYNDHGADDAESVKARFLAEAQKHLI